MNGMVVSVTVGKVRMMSSPEAARADLRGPAWSTGIFKLPVEGAVRVTRTGIEGDGQADLKNHGGPDNVILAYAAGHYPVWRKELGIAELAYGSFGENVTIEGDFADETVCVGDVWKIGDVVLEVSQPRQPCWKLARRLERADIVDKVMERGWGGWYSRVILEGSIGEGMQVELVERKYPEWPVVRAVRAMYERKNSRGPARELAQVAELSARWKRELLEG